MTDRERWIVYPLLFLTLGIVIKDKLANLVQVNQILCKSLVVTDREGRDQVVIRSTAAGGMIEASGLVQSRGMFVLDKDGKEQAGLVSTPAGGLLKTHNNALNLGIDVGNYDRLAGLIVHDNKGNVFPPTIQFQPPQAKQEQPEADQPAQETPPEEKPRGEQPEVDSPKTEGTAIDPTEKPADAKEASPEQETAPATSP